MEVMNGKSNESRVEEQGGMLLRAACRSVPFCSPLSISFKRLERSLIT